MNSPNDGSYRDRHSGVRFENQTVVRSFDDEGAQWFRSAREAGLLGRLAADGLIIEHEIRSDEPLIVEAPMLPVVTYPYEWTPSMLKDAALVTLNLASAAWDAGFHLRDASAFNIVFDGGRPVMVDLGSFKPGHTSYFLAYGQFCDHFLNPLAISAETGVSPRALWNGLEGVPADVAKALMGSRARRPKYLRHIWARAKLEGGSSSLGANERRSVRDEYGLPPEAIRKSFDNLKRLIESIDVEASGAWGSYEVDCSYDDDTTRIKSEFVSAAAARHAGITAFDIGANTGNYSALLADHFDSVIAIEPDESAADCLFQRVRNGSLPGNVHPMVLDIVDPSGGRGFRNRERPAALERLGRADLVVWLAIIHHLVLSRNLPLELVFDLASSLSSKHVFEHVSPDDPMSELLLAARDEAAWPLDREHFERVLRDRFEIDDVVDVTGTRRLYQVTRI